MQESSNQKPPDPPKMAETAAIYAAAAQAVVLEEIEAPATPDSGKGLIPNIEPVKTESPKLLKPVLGKLQAKKRLMAFANKFSPVPKVHKLKTKSSDEFKSKREEKVLAIEQIVREESRSRLVAQGLAEAHASGIRNGIRNRERSNREYRDDRSDEHYSRRSRSSHYEKSDRYRRRSRDRKGEERNRDSPDRNKARHQTSRRSPESNFLKSDKHKKDKRDKRDKEKREDSKKHEESKGDKSKIEDLKSDLSKLDEPKLEDNYTNPQLNIKEDLKFEGIGQEQVELDTNNQMITKEKEVSQFEGNHKEETILDTDKEDLRPEENKKDDLKPESIKTEDIKNLCLGQEEVKVDEEKIDTKIEQKKEECKDSKVEKTRREELKPEKKRELVLETNIREDPKPEVVKRDDLKIDAHKEKREGSRERKHLKVEGEKREGSRERKHSKLEGEKREDLRDSRLDRDEFHMKRDDTSAKREGSRDKKLDFKEKREETKIKVHKEREREKEKVREFREKELIKCRCWADLRKAGFIIDDVGYIRRNDMADKADKIRSSQDYNQYLEQMLLLSDYRQQRFAYIAEGLSGPKEFPPETIRTTKCKSPLLYSENPRVSLMLNRREVLNIVSPARREKMEDICDATQIRIVTSEREEGQHQRIWYRTLDPSKSIQRKASIEVPSFPKSKWDSDDEASAEETILKLPKETDEIPPQKESRESSKDKGESAREEPEIRVAKHKSKKKEKRNRSPSKKRKKRSPSKKSEKRTSSPSKKVEKRSSSPSKKSEKRNAKKPSPVPEIPLTIEKPPSPSPPPMVEEITTPVKKIEPRAASPLKKMEIPISSPHKEVQPPLSPIPVPENPPVTPTKIRKPVIVSEKKIDKPKIVISERKIEEVEKLDKIEISKIPSPQPLDGDDKLVSEYEQFMKMVSSSDAPGSPKSCNMEQEIEMVKPLSFDEFELETSKLNMEECASLDKSDLHSSRESIVALPLEKSPPIQIEHSPLNEEEERRVAEMMEQPETNKNKEESDSHSVPSDWENVRIKLERFSDEDMDLKKSLKKKKRKRRESWSSDSSSSSSSSSDSEEVKKRKKKRRRVRKKSTSESDSSGSSSGDSSSSEEIRKKKKKKASKKKRKKKVKRSAKKTKKKRSRKISADSSSSDESYVKLKKKKAKKANLSKKKKNKKAESIAALVIEKTKSKSASNDIKDSERRSKSKSKGKSKKKSNSSKHLSVDAASLEKELTRKIIEELPHESSENFSDFWEKDSIPLPLALKETVNEPREAAEDQSQENDGMSMISAEKLKEKNQEVEVNQTIELDISKLSAEIDSQKKKKKKEVKSNEAFLDEWEKEGKRMSQLQDSDKVYVPEKKDDWNDMDFDALNVPSLMQLEEEVGKRDMFANEWEVDSLEAIPSLDIQPKKLDKGVKYDKKTDTYIPLERELSKDIKRKKERLSSVRIWEDEQEEGEREELLLSETKSRHKRKDHWESDEEFPFSKTQQPAVNLTEKDTLSDSKLRECSEVSSTKKVESSRPRKKSRWDVESQSEDRFDVAVLPSVMWEEETAIWPKISTDRLMINSPLLEAIGSRVKTDKNIPSLSSNYTPPKNAGVDSPETLRRKMEEIAMLERALHAESVENIPMPPLPPMPPMPSMKRLDLSLELPQGGHPEIVPTGVPPPTDRNFTLAKTELLLKKEEDAMTTSMKIDPVMAGKVKEVAKFSTGWAEICPPVDVKLNTHKLDSSRTSKCVEQIKTLSNSSGEDTKLVETIDLEDNSDSKLSLKLIPKQLLVRRGNEYLKGSEIGSTDDFTEAVIFQAQKKATDVALVENKAAADSRKRDVGSKSPVKDQRRKSPTRRDRDRKDNEDRGKLVGRSSDRDKRSDHQSRESRVSPSSDRGKWKSSSPSTWERSRSRSNSRNRSRTPSPRRKRDDRFKGSDSRRERSGKSPVKQTSLPYKRSDVKSRLTLNKSDRDRGKRRYDEVEEMDKLKDQKPYDPMEILRERGLKDQERFRNRMRGEDEPHKSWRHPESAVGEKLGGKDEDHENKTYSKDDKSQVRGDSLDRENKDSSRLGSSIQNRNRDKGKTDKRDRDRRFDRSSRSPEGSNRRDKLPLPRKSPIRSTKRSPPRSKFSSRSPSRSWTRSRSRSPTRTRSRSSSRSRSRSRSRSESRTRVRNAVENIPRPVEKPVHARLGVPERPRNDEDRWRTDEERRRVEEPVVRTERPCRNDTIIQLTGSSDTAEVTTAVETDVATSSDMDDINNSHFRYSAETDNENDYRYYPGRNLTYPPRIDEAATSSPKRLSLDDRLELELGIKKQNPPPKPPPTPNFSSPGFTGSGAPGYANSPQTPQHGMYRQHQHTVLQVGNVLQVVPGDYSSMPPTARNDASTPTSQVVRVGNVLQVVPTTSIDWAGVPPPSADRSRYTAAISSTPPITVPLPIPAVSAIAPIPVPLPIPLPIPLPTKSPLTPTATPIQTTPVKAPTLDNSAQPVYNYEAILESRNREKEERQRVREINRKEKERRRFERAKRRAEKILGKNKDLSLTARRIGLPVPIANADSVVLEHECEEAEVESSPGEKPEKDTMVDNEEEEEEVEEEEEEEEEQEAEDEEEEQEEEEEEEEESVEDKLARAIKELDSDWTLIPPTPLKGILISPGFGISNGSMGEKEELSEIEKDESKSVRLAEMSEEGESSTTIFKSMSIFRRVRVKKSVQFADGVRPGEGTSPSGGEGDMPSPPPPVPLLTQETLLEGITRLQARKVRKKPKRVKLPKNKKKVKVKIIKLKKPRISPLSAMMMEDSDEADDRSPPPPPPGSPPPPHLWPSYLSAYGTNQRPTMIPSLSLTPSLSTVQTPPPPTPLPLLIPPPPLNYTIQPCSKA